jgi:hypothetical protein
MLMGEARGLSVKVSITDLDLVKKAYATANNAIYSGDFNIYEKALYAICETLNPQGDNSEIGARHISWEEYSEDEDRK